MGSWSDIVDHILHPSKEITIAMAGKYTQVPECYHSVNEAIIHAGAANDCRVNVKWLDTEALETDDDPQAALARLQQEGTLDGIIIP